jgi:hypothetical protein
MKTPVEIIENKINHLLTMPYTKNYYLVINILKDILIEIKEND